MNSGDLEFSPGTAAQKVVKVEDVYEVILHNDNLNEAGYVVSSLMRVLKHNEHLAYKIMIEAHTRGQSVAEVESEAMARLHMQQLQSCGLVVTVSMI